MSSSTSKKHILVVEDDKIMNTVVQKKFQKAGFQTTGCNDGTEGLAMMKQNVYDGIILDLMMPVVDGFTVLKERNTTLNAATPIFGLTALNEEKCKMARDLGAVKTFIKSKVALNDVVEEVKKDLGA